jgi:putative ABC transport system permease protein
MRLRHLLLRQWRARPGRAFVTAASVAIAVGAVVATWVAAEASRAGYRRITESIDGLPCIDVVARGGGRFPAASMPRLGDLPGVRAAVPLFYRPTLVRSGEQRVREIAVGVDAEALVAAGLLELSAGEPCVGPDETILDAGLAASLGKSVGDEVLFFARRRIRRLTITGLAESRALRWFGEGGGVVIDIEPLTSMSLSTGFVDRVRVVLEQGTSRAEARNRVAAVLPPELDAEIPTSGSSMAEDLMHSSFLGLDFVTGLTVAMAWFIVGNAMLMNVTERRRGLSLLRLLGATGRQIRRFVAGEAAILGGIGAIAGTTLGLLAARPIARNIGRALQAPDTGLVVAPWIVPVAVLLGTGVAVAAAAWPARRAAEIDPLEGLGQAPPPPERGVSWRYLAIVLGLALVAGGVLLLMLAEVLPAQAAVPGGIALTLAFVAVTPLALPLLVRGLGWLVPRAWRIEGALAEDHILRQPVRTALTTGVLVLAVSNGVGLGHAIRDNVDDLLGWYARMMQADWLLTRAGALGIAPDREGADPRAAEAAVRALAGVQRVEGIGVAAGKVAGSPCVIVARDLDPTAPLPLVPAEGTAADLRAALDRGEAAAGTMLARRTGIQPGDEVVVEAFGRSVTVRVAALVVDYTSGGSSLHVRRDVGTRLFGMEAADILLVTAEPGRAATLAEPLAEIARESSMLVRSFGDVTAFVDTLVRGVVRSLQAILGLGFVVGSLGVANTVTMSVLEKRRALGLLRAVGMSSGRVTRMVVLESVLLGAAGGITGMLAGVTTALFIQLASQPMLGHPIRFSLRPSVLAGNLVAALVVTALAAWLPARRAVRMELLEAIAAE